jgi:hypothetical protein
MRIVKSRPRLNLGRWTRAGQILVRFFGVMAVPAGRSPSRTANVLRKRETTTAPLDSNSLQGKCLTLKVGGRRKKGRDG